MQALSEKILTPHHLQTIFQKVSKEVKKKRSHIPKEITLKKLELDKVETRINRFVEFVAQAKATPSLVSALEADEEKALNIKNDLKALKASQTEDLEVPPIEWISHRIKTMQNLLEKKTEKSALLLRSLVGKITLFPKTTDLGKSYYEVKSKLKTLSLLRNPVADSGSISLQWWREQDSNLRRQKPTVLQTASFNHSDIPPIYGAE